MIATPDFPPFRPHPLIANANVMTLAGSLSRAESRALVATGEDRVFQTVRGNAVTGRCHWQEDRSRPAVMLLHGLMGDFNSPYVVGTAQKAFAHGFQVVRINARGCGGTEALAKESCHGGLTEDVEAVARQLIETEGVPRLYLMGFSLGGNIILKLAGELSDDAPDWLAGVATMSPCIDFGLSCDALRQTLLGRLCERNFLNALRATVRERWRLHDQTIDIKGLNTPRTLRAFDDRYTGPMGGFADGEDYYRRASGIAVMPEIRIPSLLLTARDDPLVPFSTFERPEITQNPCLTVLATDRGGHTAFIGRTAQARDGFLDSDRRWAENRLVQFCLQLEQQSGYRANP